MLRITEGKYVTLDRKAKYFLQNIYSSSCYVKICLFFLNEGHQTHIARKNVTPDLIGGGCFYNKLSTDHGLPRTEHLLFCTQCCLGCVGFYRALPDRCQDRERHHCSWTWTSSTCWKRTVENHQPDVQETLWLTTSAMAPGPQGSHQIPPILS